MVINSIHEEKLPKSKLQIQSRIQTWSIKSNTHTPHFRYKSKSKIKECRQFKFSVNFFSFFLLHHLSSFLSEWYNYIFHLIRLIISLVIKLRVGEGWKDPNNRIKAETANFELWISSNPTEMSFCKWRDFELKFLCYVGLVVLKISYKCQRKRIFLSENNAFARNTHISQYDEKIQFTSKSIILRGAVLVHVLICQYWSQYWYTVHSKKIGFFPNSSKRFCRCQKASKWVEISKYAIKKFWKT